MISKTRIWNHDEYCYGTGPTCTCYVAEIDRLRAALIVCLASIKRNEGQYEENVNFDDALTAIEECLGSEEGD